MNEYKFKEVTISKVIPKHDSMILEKVLSKNELLVLQKIIEGYTHAEIAYHVFLSKRTIDGIARRIRKKMDCVSNIQLAVKALNEGLFVLGPVSPSEINYIYCHSISIS